MSDDRVGSEPEIIQARTYFSASATWGCGHGRAEQKSTAARDTAEVPQVLIIIPLVLRPRLGAAGLEHTSLHNVTDKRWRGG